MAVPYDDEVEYCLNPSLRRAVASLRSEPDRPPLVLGDNDHPINLTVYVNPRIDACWEFFRDSYDDVDTLLLQQDVLKVTFRPVAPAHRSTASTISEGLRAAVHSPDPEARADSTIVGEFLQTAVQMAANAEAAKAVVERVCQIADRDQITYQWLHRVAEQMGGASAPKVFEALNIGAFRAAVTRDTRQWVSSLSRANIDAPSVILFINGYPVEQTDYDTISEQVGAVQELQQTRGSVEDNNQ